MKKCNDLLLLRSDAYMISEDHIPVLHPACRGVAPIISLDSKKYKLVEALEEATAHGVPSLVDCKRLAIKGIIHMSSSTRFVGDVAIVNRSEEARLVHGIIQDTELDVSNHDVELDDLTEAKRKPTTVELLRTLLDLPIKLLYALLKRRVTRAERSSPVASSVVVRNS